MTTLAESFLADLDDLSDDSDREHVDQQQPEGEDPDQVFHKAGSPTTSRSWLFLTLTPTHCCLQMLVDDVEKLGYDSLEAVAHLRASERYQDIMQVFFDL